jgi:hypothetical protein
VELPVNLAVTLAYGDANDGTSRESLQLLANQMAAEFMRVRPRVNLQLRLVPEGEFLPIVRGQAALGAGPDLMISRVTPAYAMMREGLSVPSSLERRELAPFKIRYLDNFLIGRRYQAIPFLLQPTLACYNRRRLPRPPQRLEDLPRLAARGHTLGLPLTMAELLWTATGFQAQPPLFRMLEPSSQGGQGTKVVTIDRLGKDGVVAWLHWLYRSNVEPNLIYVDDANELINRLEARQLDWISCQAPAIPRLRRKLGADLAVDLLPAGPDGRPARSLTRLQVLSFGRDSNAQQRKIAEAFTLFILNDFSQSNLMARAIGNLPVNQNVVIPVKESRDLEVMKRSLASAIVPSFRQGVRLIQLAEPLHLLLKQDVYGQEGPEQVYAQLEALGQGGSAPDDRAGVGPQAAAP